MYKAGQLITINNKVYRVTNKTNTGLRVAIGCRVCPFDVDPIQTVCIKYCFTDPPGKKIPTNCYFKPI